MVKYRIMSFYRNGFSMHRGVFNAWILATCVVLIPNAHAGIRIDGVLDTKVYRDQASFTVYSEEGHDDTVTLNGKSIATDVQHEIDTPDYYELSVIRQSLTTGNNETALLRFIVRSSAHGNSESGLPLWNPYRLVASAPEEFSEAQLDIVVPAAYPRDLAIPVIARVENHRAKRLGVNGSVTSSEFPDTPLPLMRGVGSVFLPAASESGILSYSARIGGLQTRKQIRIDASTAWQIVSSDITESTTWESNARIYLVGGTDGRLTIAEGTRLTIEAGAVIIIGPSLDVAVKGHIVVNGTRTQPVVFTPRDPMLPWGGFLFESSEAQGQFTHTVLTGSGAASNWFGDNPGHGSAHRKEQCLFYLSQAAHVTLVDCSIDLNDAPIVNGTLHFVPGETLKVIPLPLAAQVDNGHIQATLHHPVNARLTEYSDIVILDTRE